MLANSQSQSREYLDPRSAQPLTTRPTDTASEVSKQARALTGTVTKLLDNFGFIDDSVFFQLSVVKGGDVHVGDKVYCECSFSEHLPFKWNAQKVHKVQSGSAGAPSPQVATTYLQHRLQQQSGREEPSPAPLVANSHNNQYFSTQASANSSFSTIDFAKAQSAVAAAQQLASYYGGTAAAGGRSESAQAFSQLQYTSTPGSAFVSSAPLPFTQQIQQNLLSTQPRSNAPSTFKSSASRWEREERFRARDSARQRDVPSARKRDDSRDRSLNKDEFGRDLRARDKSKERDRKHAVKRSVSPTSSVSSQNQSARVARRRYEPVNIPKLTILKSSLNVYDIKQRYSTSLHIPSDLKEVQINNGFALNINEMPKPITYRVVESESKKKKTEDKKDDAKSSKEDKKDDAKSSKEDKKDDSKSSKEDKKESKEDKMAEKENDKSEEKDKQKADTEETNGKPESEQKSSSECKTTEAKSPPEAKVDSVVPKKQSYKYNVKVVLISVPSLNDIFERVFGSDFDAISTGSKSYFLHFNKLLSFLVSRNSNDGFSLIGGKFLPQVDGYFDGTDEPNLIQTAIRVVGEQTGLNLTKCGKWRLISTFVFNRDSSVDPTTTSLELTRVYMPDVWSAFDTIYEPLKSTVNELQSDNQIVLTNDKLENKTLEPNHTNCDQTSDKNQSIAPEDTAPTDTSLEADAAMDLSHTSADQNSSVASIVESATASGDSLVPSDAPSLVDQSSVHETSQDESAVTDAEDQTAVAPGDQQKSSSGSASELQLLLSRISDLKVAELRKELEKRGAILKGNLKKADLVSKLRQMVTDLLRDEDVVSDEVKNDWWAQRIFSKDSANEDSEDKADEEATDEEKPAEEHKESVEVTMAESETAVKESASGEPIESEKAVEESDEQQMVVDSTEATVTEEPEVTAKEGAEVTANGSVKRKSDSEDSPAKDSKKAKNGDSGQKFPTKVTDGCVHVKGVDNNLTVITLHEALNHQRYDQFEMSIVSEVIRESLIQHFSHYILSALVANHKHPLPKDDKSGAESKSPKPVNYVHLSFSYFDASRCGHLIAEDLLKLLSNANFTLSRKAFSSLVNNEDKITYRDLPEPSKMLKIEAKGQQQRGRESAKSGKIFEKNGTLYDIEELIDQSEADEKTKVKLNEELTANKERFVQLNEYIEELESRQKKMNLATQKQNDEICSLKRDRERLASELGEMRKAMENCYSEFGKVLGKNEKKESESQQKEETK